MIVCGILSNIVFGFILNRTQKYREAVIGNSVAVFFALIVMIAMMSQQEFVAAVVGFGFFGFCLFPYYGIYLNAVAEFTCPVPVK